MRTFAFSRLLALFTIVPLIELALLIEVGRHIGTAGTIGIVLGTAVFGAFLARREGLAVIWRTRRELEMGRLPAAALLEGVAVLIGAVLLITPGILTDTAGLLMLIPATRRGALRLLRRYLERRFLRY